MQHDTYEIHKQVIWKQENRLLNPNITRKSSMTISLMGEQDLLGSTMTPTARRCSPWANQIVRLDMGVFVCLAALNQSSAK